MFLSLTVNIFSSVSIVDFEQINVNWVIGTNSAISFFDLIKKNKLNTFKNVIKEEQVKYIQKHDQSQHVKLKMLP